MSGDLVKALEFYSKAADGGNAKAQFILGTAFEFGKFGLEEGKDQAFELYRKAADGGCSEAQHRLGEAYEIGEFGLEVDKDQASEL